MSSHLDKTTLQFFTCPFSLNLALSNGNLFTVDLQDYFVLPSKLFSTSQYYTDLRLLQEYYIACYSVPCEELPPPPPMTITVIMVFFDRFQKCMGKKRILPIVGVAQIQ